MESCTRGSEVMDKIGEFKPDLVIVDLMMPEVDWILSDSACSQDGSGKLPADYRAHRPCGN